MNFTLISCAQKPNTTIEKNIVSASILKTGGERTNLYLNLLKGKNVAIVGNQTSIIQTTSKNKVQRHLVDSLLSLDIKVKKVFAPEHGFRGKADAGEIVKNGIDTKTGLPIISLYGKNKKPSAEQLKNIDVVVFDIQDVGARFYTYISSLHYVMEACAELKIPVIILDRPNPNGHYIDGPVLELAHKSFVGMHKVPVVYGMTIGEYGKMINGEKWLENEIKCDLTVIPLENYTHKTEYSLPVKPSPNLPNDKSINLYPSLCFFEGTTVSAGRGTEMQFQIAGSPYLKLKRFYFEFKPKPNNGAKYPKHKGEICYGYDLRNEEKLTKIELKWLIDFYKGHKNYAKEKDFFNTFFTKLAGTEKLQKQIEQGVSEKEIRKTWTKDLNEFKLIRNKYLIYK
ncbi:exo-beta-N-acetylmuramidase NamZ domain-containing protein [Polaribacter sp. KT25b]|uniref:exo-beta-N-acetylmuramidase NamZ family protein n=1 Tax=Polaribacter sp. KT25b TaxID=1855336 RepID=UPI001E5A8152|nr:DUF1343 domain-containing protein [Polaribacter sp. KT25b]